MPDQATSEPIDVRHLGAERVICCWRVGDILIDPGPQSTEQTLVAALGGRRPRALLLTHIHFDHAGATGALVRRWPDLEVYVHEIGLPHLVDPSRLVSSARRLYGEDFDRLWGDVVPVPEENLRPLRGGEQVEGLEVAYTPGHAPHHVCYFDPESRTAFVGDVAGVRIAPSGYGLGPTPPPDIDLEQWERSMQLLERWAPRALGLTHFGPVDDPPAQLEQVRRWFARWAPLARDLDQATFAARVSAEVKALGKDVAPAYLQASPPEQLWLGLDRYWRKRAERPPEA